MTTHSGKADVGGSGFSAAFHVHMGSYLLGDVFAFLSIRACAEAIDRAF